MIPLGDSILGSADAVSEGDILTDNGKVFYPGMRLDVLDGTTRAKIGSIFVEEIVGDRLICGALPPGTKAGDLLQLPTFEVSLSLGEWTGLERS